MTHRKLHLLLFGTKSNMSEQHPENLLPLSEEQTEVGESSLTSESIAKRKEKEMKEFESSLRRLGYRGSMDLKDIVRYEHE